MTAAASTRPTIKSQLLPELLPRNLEHPITVFDAGLAVADTLNFFSRYRCRLHFMDMYDEPIIRQQQTLSYAELVSAFQQQLDFPAGTTLDVCLFWDFLNYLDESALRAFCTALTPFLHAKTTIHAFGVHKAGVALPGRSYGVVDHQTISVSPRNDVPLAAYPHKQGELNNRLPNLEVVRGTLLADGMLDMRLKVLHT